MNQGHSLRDGRYLWHCFKTSWCEQAHNIPPRAWEESWRRHGGRTRLYEMFLPEVCDYFSRYIDLELVFKKEEYKIDYTFRINDGIKKAPLVFIESENDSLTSDSEMRKLCYFNSPLRVLIICERWEEQNFQRYSGKKEMLINIWSRTIDEFNVFSDHESVIGVVIAEASDSFRFYSVLFDHEGRIFDEDGSTVFCELPRDW